MSRGKRNRDFDLLVEAALFVWVEDGEFEDQDEAYEALNDLLQPVLEELGVPS